MRRPPNLMKDTAALRAEPTHKPAAPEAPSNYLDLYGLSKPPFGVVPDSSGYILFGSHRRAFELIIDHIMNGAGLMLVQGEEGIGKTETLRSAAAVAGESGLETIIVSRPPGGRTTLSELISALNGQGGSDETKAQDGVGHFLRPPRKALLIDDFDLLPDDCIQLLWSLMQLMPNDPPAPAILLSSSVDLTADIKQPDVMQIVGLARNTVRLLRLGPAEIRQYIERSLWVSGGTTRRLITADAMKVLIVRSGGIPGIVNRLMEAAFTAGYARGDPMISAKTVAAAVGPSAPRPSHRESARSRVAEHAMQIVSIGLLLIGTAVFVYRGMKDYREHPAPVRSPSPAPAQIRLPLSSPGTATPTDKPQNAKIAETLSPTLIAALIKRGDQSLELGDIAAARLLFQRAAEAGNATAAMALGKTYDPSFVAPGSRAEPARAAEWYQKAITLGDPRAADLLRRLGVH